jgi:hypothetical protein
MKINLQQHTLYYDILMQQQRPDIGESGATHPAVGHIGKVQN